MKDLRQATSPWLFALTILGFTFWFVMAVPLASHKEAYSWLPRMREGQALLDFVQQTVATYRPIGQAIMWWAYQVLGFADMPSDAIRQGIVQTTVWATILPGWWLMLRASPAPRVFSLLAMAAGGVLFTPYLFLFHPWGLFYTPLVLTTAALVWLALTRTSTTPTTMLALLVAAAVLALWHPFATALIVAYLLGTLIEQVLQGRKLPLALPVALLLIVAAMGYMGRQWLMGSGHGLVDKLDGLLMTFQTVEVNKVVSLFCLVLVQLVVFTLPLQAGVRWAVAAVALLASGLAVYLGMSVLMVWLVISGVKAMLLGRWRLAATLGVAFLLPLGSGVGAPVYALFAIMLSLSVTALGQDQLERRAALIPGAAWLALIVGAMSLSLLQRQHDVPGLASLARPLLAEKARTQQLEQGLHWLARSAWCHADVDFFEPSQGPTVAKGNIINRERRPPTEAGDLQAFWTTYRCKPATAGDTTPLIMFTFGGQDIPGASALYSLESPYAGLMRVWLVSRPMAANTAPTSNPS
jgi:hypothetical protein